MVRPVTTTPDAPTTRTVGWWARRILAVVAVIGAVLSYKSLYLYAEPKIGREAALAFPLLVDALVLGASLQYIDGVRKGRPIAGWRLAAHIGVAGTIFLNFLAADGVWADVPVHVAAPIVWSVLVELTAREVLGDYRAAHDTPADRIPLRLWLSAPLESARTALLMARTGERSAAHARVLLGLHAAARQALRLAVPGIEGRRVRRAVVVQLRAGSLDPRDLLDALGDHDIGTDGADHRDVLRAVTRYVLTAHPPAAPPVKSRPTVKPKAPPVKVEVVAVDSVPVDSVPVAPAAEPDTAPTPPPTPPAGLPAVLATVPPGARRMYEVVAAANGKEVTTDVLVLEHGLARASVKDWAPKLIAADLIDRPRPGVFCARKLAAA